MARSFTAVPPDSTGDKLAMRTYPVGADTMHSQGVHFDGVPTYGLFIDNSAVATNKYHLYLRNDLSLIHISEPTRRTERSRMPSSA